PARRGARSRADRARTRRGPEQPKGARGHSASPTYPVRRRRSQTHRSTRTQSHAEIAGSMIARTLGLLACLVALASTAAAARKIPIRIPATTVDAGGATEGCYFVRIPGAAPFDLGSWQITNQPHGVTVLHTIVYLYRGERLAEFATQARRVIFSKGCLDLGPADRDSRQMIAGITRPTGRGALATRVAPALRP